MERGDIDTVVFHYPCNDGFASAWIAQLYLGKDVEFIGCKPGDAAPCLKDKNVLMVDISWSRDETEKMYREAQNLLILDHHLTAEKNLKDLDYAKFDMNRSGCQLTWDYFYPDKDIPKFINYIGMNDIWVHKGTDAEPFMAAFSGIQTFQEFDKYLNESVVQDCIDKGKMILQVDEKRVIQMGQKAVRATWKGQSVMFINAAFPWISKLGDYLSQNGDVVMIWNKEVGRDFAVSLRSRGSLDVSKLAESMGGGGHKNAAGFRTKELPENLLD